jgi:glycosyltransferase involved in cell wall biosynthesis
VLPKVSHEKMSEYYWNADVVIDRFKLGSLGMVSLEAIACGRPAVTYVSSEFLEYEEFPLKDVKTNEEVADVILKADVKLWQREYAYLEKNHKPEIVVKTLLEHYRRVIG